MPDVISQLADDNRNVHKWRNTLLGIADASVEIPESFFSASDGLPIALPTGFKNLGYITTDGISHSYDVSSDDTNMLQDLDPVRSDITSLGHTLQVAFGETNGWTKALAHGLPVSQWPTDKNAAWIYDDGAIGDFPYYRLYTISQDVSPGGVTVYRVEFGYRAKVTDIDDRSLNGSDVEEVNRTFTFYRDPVVGKTYTEAQTAATGVTAGS